MKAYGGAGIRELIGIFILSLIGKKYDSENIGLCRDNGLSIFRNASRPRLGKIKNHTESFQRKNVKCYY